MVTSYLFLLLPFLSEFFRSRHNLDFSSLSVVRNCLAALFEETHSSSLVLRDERYLFQLIPPFICNHDGLLCLCHTLGRVSLIQSMLD